MNRTQQAIENNCKLIFCFREDTAPIIWAAELIGNVLEGVRPYLGRPLLKPVPLAIVVEGIMKTAFVVSAILFMVLFAVSALPASAENVEHSLYHRLGGEPVMVPTEQ
jgi:hypothetical protein